MKSVPTFQTYDVDLAAFLMLEGLKFVECQPEDGPSKGKPRVCMVFLDEKGIGRDLERVFLNSQFKAFRTYQKYLLKEIHRTIRGI